MYFITDPWPVAVAGNHTVYYVSARNGDEGIRYKSLVDDSSGLIPGSDFGPRFGRSLEIGPVTG